MLGSGFAAALPHVMSIITLQAILENIPLVLNGRGEDGTLLQKSSSSFIYKISTFCTRFLHSQY